MTTNKKKTETNNGVTECTIRQFQKHSMTVESRCYDSDLNTVRIVIYGGMVNDEHDTLILDPAKTSDLCDILKEMMNRED